MPTILDSGRAALAAGEWARAREAFTAALRAEDDPAAWEGLSWAVWWLSDEPATLEARECAYRGHRAAGDPCGAARMALWLVIDLMDFRGDDAVAGGWLERGRRLLEDVPQCAEHGWLRLIEADFLMRTRGDYAT